MDYRIYILLLVESIVLLSIAVVTYKTMLPTILHADASLSHIFISASCFSSQFPRILNICYHAVENSAEMAN